MKKVLFIALLLVGCSKNNKFHKAIQGDYEIRTIKQYGGNVQHIQSGAQGFEFTITENTLTGWHFNNSEYEVLDYGVLYATNVSNVSGEVNIELTDSLRFTDVYGNVLTMGSK